jgi:MFS family permease
MGVATSLIGVLPTYESIGIWAPALLVSFRLAQGIAAGTEYAGAATLLAEYAPTRRRGFFSAVPAAGLLVGIGIAAGISGLTASLPRDQLLAWGWRIPFLISIVLIAVGLFLRLKVLESPIFATAQKRPRARVPVAAALKKAPRRLILTTIANSPIAFIAQLLQVFVLAYLADRGVKASVSLVGVFLAALIGAIAVLALSGISDRTGRRPIYLGMLAVTAVTPFPLFLLLNTEDPVLIWLAMIVAWLGISAALGVQASYYVELFETSYRVTGIALAREIGAGFLGAPAPVIAAALTVQAGGRPWLIATIMVLIGVAGVAAAVALPETRGVDLSPPAET